MATGAKTGGRVAGTPNKATATMKAAVQAVYDKLQASTGKEHGHFLKWAEEQPTEFYKLASKLIPIQNEHSGTIETSMKDQRDAAVREAVSRGAK